MVRNNDTIYRGRPLSGFHYGNNNMMGYGMGGGDLFGLLISLVILVDLVLVGIWLWQQIKK